MSLCGHMMIHFKGPYRETSGLFPVFYYYKRVAINNLGGISFCTCAVCLWDKFPDVVLLGQAYLHL